MLAWVALVAVQHTAAAMSTTVLTTVPAALDAYEMKVAVQGRMLLMMRMALQPDVFEREPDARLFEAQRSVFEKERAELESLALDSESRETLAKVLREATRLSEQQLPIVEALLLGEDARARHLLHDDAVFQSQRSVDRTLRQLVSLQERRLNEALASTQREHERIQGTIVALGLGLLALGATIGVTVTAAARRAAAVLDRDRRTAETLALTDPLTGLLNRRAVQRDLARWCHPGGGALLSHSVLAIDLDGFKFVNDTAGHEAGDALLRGLAQAMIGCTRPEDRVARVGGDEFVVLLRNMDGEAAVAVAERLLRAICAFELPWQGRSLRVSASIGVARLEPGSGDSAAAAAFEAADAACYRAKRGGKNRICVADRA
ncbi:MAG: diguanylate cyclase [Burkholderiaceae bacterium]